MKIIIIEIPDAPAAKRWPTRNGKPKRAATLRNWEVERMGSHALGLRLKGEVYDHPKFMNGSRVLTSPLLRLDAVTGQAETLNTVYTLETL
jgi:hypothetical protein